MKCVYLFIFAASLLILTGCTTSAADKQTLAYVSIDEAYPVFNLGKASDPGNVRVPASKQQIAKWKAAAAAYISSQKEIEALVNHYEPAAIKAELKKPSKKN